MPFISVNSANLFYQTYGQKQPGQPPVLLIHGSTQTGYSCWNKVAPLLAEDFFVIVPDCRGHGQSDNPNKSYSFREMAADMAALIQALGFTRAHIVGHSNGGNVALVMLVEHPDVVQTCVVQAGNAWVSPDLVEKEPRIFSPDFVSRERPDWMNEMILLHGPTHGVDYWRTLLQLTVKEIISEPNYAPADLGKVTRPALIVQGENDSANAPGRHAQFIARHIPFAGLWIPKGVGHNVHDEILNEWMATARDFFSRRGNDESEALYRHRLNHHKDERSGIFDVRLSDEHRLGGIVLNEEMRTEALDLLKTAIVADELNVLIKNDTPWALMNRPVEDLRRNPSILAERVSQARMGEAARLIESAGEWGRIRLEHDGYLGWVHTQSLFLCEESLVSAYLDECNAIVSAPLAEAWDEADAQIQKIPFATLVRMEEVRGNRAVVRLPDGRAWRLNPADLVALSQRPRPTREGIAQTLALVRRFCGVPYLWGGRTPYGFDCSGLSGAFYGFMGVIIPRDADQQYEAGLVVEGKPEAGDLLFFGETNEDGTGARISHVAISLGGDDMIHANGSDWGVSYNSLNPQDRLYRKWLADNYRGARRFR